MLRVNKAKSGFLTFSDGWGAIYKVIDRHKLEKRQAVVHYRENTVGERRFWDALVNGVEIQRAVSVPLSTNVERGDLFMIGDEQYVVVQKDRKDTLPVSWLLSLESATIRYSEAKDGEGNG